MKKIFSLLSGVLSLYLCFGNNHRRQNLCGRYHRTLARYRSRHEICLYDIPAYPLKFHVMEVDLTNPYVDIETCLSGDKAVATETLSSMSARNNRPGHEVLGATNGDFYQYQDPIEIGIPAAGNTVGANA